LFTNNYIQWIPQLNACNFSLLRPGNKGISLSLCRL